MLTFLDFEKPIADLERFGWQHVGRSSVIVGCFDCVFEELATVPMEDRVWDWRVTHGFASDVPL